jgi:hypothetical protein
MAPNATPMITPTARSTTFPERAISYPEHCIPPVAKRHEYDSITRIGPYRDAVLMRFAAPAHAAHGPKRQSPRCGDVPQLEHKPTGRGHRECAAANFVTAR